jgi:hypothetical protein
LAEVGVVEEPVHGRGGDGFGHELIEAGGVDIRADRQGPLLVGGLDNPVEALAESAETGKRPMSSIYADIRID